MRVLNAPLLALALVAGLGAVPALAGTLTVVGEATVQVDPDIATISLGVTTTGATAAEAMASNSEGLAKVIARLTAAGIEEKDLQTSNLSLSPNWTGYDSSATPTISGYTASNMLNVRVRDLSALGSILDASITDGANTLNGITFEIANPRPVQDEARKAAVADAAARAALLAEAAGLKLGKVESLSENAGFGMPTPVFKAAADSARAVPIASGQVGINASVTVVYQTE